MSEGVDLSSLGAFNFTPAWAKGEAKVSVGKVRPERETESPRMPGKRPNDRPQGGAPRSSADRKPFRKRFEERPRPVERPRPLDAEVKILPETRALGTIIRKLQNDTHAYKLKDLAYFFLDNPQSILLKVTPRAGEGAAPQGFCQCKACGFVALREEDLLQHLLTAHLTDYYDAKEIDCEPPKGNFNCVARCGLSGVILGPPNLHEFNAIVREMIRTRYPEMSEEQYRSHLEMVRESEAIEEWRKSAVKKTVFFAKGTAEQEGAVSLSREQAEGEFRRTILPSLIDHPKHLMITAAMAERSPVKPLVWAVRDAISEERRQPYNMCFALRGAFHHRKLKFFRVNDAHGQEFVTNMDLKPFDIEHAIPELATVAKFIAEHPCCDKSELPPDADSEKQLSWLVSTGHVVAFTNGVYSAVEKFPKYGPQWKKRQSKPESEAKVEPEVKSEPEVKAEVEEKQDEVTTQLAE